MEQEQVESPNAESQYEYEEIEVSVDNSNNDNVFLDQLSKQTSQEKLDQIITDNSPNPAKKVQKKKKNL